MKDFRTVREPSEIEIVINKSRFIGRCYPVAEEREALEILERIATRIPSVRADRQRDFPTTESRRERRGSR